VALVVLLNHAYTRRYPIPFLNARATWLPWQCPLRYRKRGPDRSSAPKMLSFDEKFAKIGPSDPEIIVFREKKDLKKKEITEGKIYSPVGNLAEWAKKVKSPIVYLLNCRYRICVTRGAVFKC